MPRVLWKVPKDLKGQTAFCVAPGPSLETVDVAQLEGLNLIAVKAAADYVPFAQQWFFMDRRLLLTHKDKLKDFAGDVVTTCDVSAAALRPRVRLLENGDASGLSIEPDTLCHGGNSGYAAVNLAFLRGAANIVLVGYDWRTVDGRTHAGRTDGRATDSDYVRATTHFEKLAAALKAKGVRVFNATPGSALTCFESITLEAAVGLACGVAPTVHEQLADEGAEENSGGAASEAASAGEPQAADGRGGRGRGSRRNQRQSTEGKKD